jgi:hypothetical protein
MAHVSPNKKTLDDLEKQAESIRRDFDQFFLGLSKRPPTTAEAQLAGLFRKMKEEELREWNTQDRFRFNQIHARFVSLERVWARTMKQIEDGTYKRDKFKVAQMRRRDAAAGHAAASTPSVVDDLAVDIDIDIDIGFDDDEVVRPAPPPKSEPKAPPPAPRPAPRPAAPVPVAAVPVAAAAPSSVPMSALGGLSEQKLQHLHKVYIDAKRKTGEQSRLSLDDLRIQVAKQVHMQQQKHGVQQVDFKVVLKDGKAMLKAIPKQ